MTYQTATDSPLQAADYAALMRILSAPRPTGSPAEREAAGALRQWLAARSIAHRSAPFRLYPYFSEAIGVWLIATASALTLALALGWGWLALLIIAASLVAGILNVLLGIPLVIWPGARRGENILIELGPPQPERELVLAAHYDTKTELLDHTRRAFLMRGLAPAIGLAATAILTGLAAALAPAAPWAGAARILAIALSLPALSVAWGLGLNLIPGRLIPQSSGAIDNGAACATLLALAAQLHAGPPLRTTRVVIALFGGEEASMQGSRAYVRGRAWPLPAAAINLELMAQDGPYVLWQRDGNALRQAPTTPWLGAAVGRAVREVTGQTPQPAPLINSDGFSFLAAGIPAAVLGTFHSRLGGGGLHRPSDTLERVVFERLPEGAAILARIVALYDAGAIAPDRPALAGGELSG